MQTKIHEPVQYRFTTRYVDHYIVPDHELPGKTICRTWNWGGCEHDKCTVEFKGKPANLTHRCSSCGGKHRLIDCTNYAAKHPADL
eukprot:COSAG01_NODE_25566_length_740_cov_70.511700_2_plen_85_part_01